MPEQRYQCPECGLHYRDLGLAKNARGFAKRTTRAAWKLQKTQSKLPVNPRQYSFTCVGLYN